MDNIRLYKSVHLIEKIVIVDGIARTGKSLLGPILGSFSNVEIERVEPIFENIALLDSIGKLKRDAAVQLLQLEADNKLYESKIGRNVNFRFTDHSGVFNNAFKWEYIKRLFKAAGPSVVDDIRKNKAIFQVQTHDTLGMIDPFFEAFDDRIRIFEMVRDPVDLIYSWHNRGWGHRFSTDPLSLSVTIDSEGTAAPWFDLITERRYKDLEPIDRIIFIIDALQKRLLNKYNELDLRRKKQVLWIIFEDFVTEPNEWLDKMESFIGTTRTRRTAGTVKKQDCPRKLDANSREEKRKFIESGASPDAIRKIPGMYDWYEAVKEVAGAQT